MASTFAKKLIRDHEGVRLQYYKDSLGILTIGIGRNLEKGISVEECLFLFENDLVEAEITLGNIFGIGIFKESEKRVAALLDMAFNMGEPKLRKFVKMIQAVKDRDWERVAIEAKDSDWYAQVKTRGKTIIELLKDDK